MINTVHLWDCLEVMKSIPDGSIDAIITDPPFWTTKCSWDHVIPFEPMWAELKRIIKPNGAIVLFGSEPFSSALRMSNIKMYKYDWVWNKTKAWNFIQSRNCPLKLHENISVFSNGVVIHKWQSKKRMNYYPQWVKEVNKEWSRPQVYESEHSYKRPSHKTERTITLEWFPSSVIRFSSEHNPPHPTQKPVALLEYLIKTYSLENEIILDFTSGSWTTWIAAQNTNRQFILIEKDKNYYDISLKRLQENKEKNLL
mgnify:FL=1